MRFIYRLVISTSIILVFFNALTSCNGSDHYRSVNENSDKALLQGKLVGQNIYSKLLTKNKEKIASCLAKELEREADTIVTILQSRDENWGKFISFEVTDVQTTEIFTDKGDTTTFYVSITAIYENNQSSDFLTIESVKKTVFKIVGYDFSSETMFSCGAYEIQQLNPIYHDFTTAFVKHDSLKIIELCNGTGEFYRDVMKIQRESFPIGTKIDSIVYNAGYMRKYCGLNGEANGLIAYSIYTADSAKLDLIYKLRKYENEDKYEMYAMLLTSNLEVDNENDVSLAKTIAKDVYKIIQKNDPKAFYDTFHTELSSLYNSKNINDLVDVVNNLKELGTFVDYYSYYTFKTEDNDFIYFVVILELENEIGDTNYMELVFKPDSNNKYMLMSCTELYH